MGSALVFISYSHPDTEFANRLKSDLEDIGISVWHDCKEIRPGESISRRIQEGLEASDYFFLVLSQVSIRSRWVDREYRVALGLQLEKGKPIIVPIRLHDVDMPKLLRDIRHVDFVAGYSHGWADLTSLFAPTDMRALRVGGGTGAGSFFLKLIISRFRERFPDRPIEERADISEELIRLVASKSAETCLDAAVIGKKPGVDLRRDIEFQEIFRDVSVLTVPPGHPLWGKEAISERALLSVLRTSTPFISRPKGSGQYEAMLGYLRPRLGRDDARVLLNRFVAYDLDSAKRFVSQGRGISIMPNLITRKDVSSDQMWAVRLPGSIVRRFYGVWAKRRRRSSVSDDFIMMLKEGVRPIEQE